MNTGAFSRRVGRDAFGESHTEGVPMPSDETGKLNLSASAPERFVDAAVAASFLSIPRKRVLVMARSGAIPAHPIGHGRRKTWLFLLSELWVWLRAKSNRTE